MTLINGNTIWRAIIALSGESLSLSRGEFSECLNNSNVNSVMMMKAISAAL
jgi:hypothetical protein